jgi:hypothetical protein
MSFSIAYLIDLPGNRFNGFLDTHFQAPKSYLDVLMQSHDSDLWNGMFPNDDLEFLVDLTGEWTLCLLPHPYSTFFAASVPPADPKATEILNRVQKWEGTLRSILPDADIIRVDDYLLDQWNSRFDYLLVRDPQAVLGFLAWLQAQDSNNWAHLLPSTDR